MNILVIVLLAIVGIIALLLIIGLFSKKGYVIERSILINKPKGEVFNYVKLLKNQDHYSKWVMKDPDMKRISEAPMAHQVSCMVGTALTKMREKVKWKSKG